MPRPPRYSRITAGLEVLLIICGFALLHSCFYALDVGTPADPQLTLACTKWHRITQLRVPDLKPTGSYTEYCKEYSYVNATH